MAPAPVTQPFPPRKVRRAHHSPSSGCTTAPPTPWALLTGGGLHALSSSPPPSSGSSSPQITFPLPRHHTHTAPPAHPLFLFSAPPHRSQKVLASHHLVPGISPEGVGLLSNLSGSTHSYHRRPVIGGSQHPLPSGAGRRQAAGRKSAGGGPAESSSKKDSIRRAEARRPRARARPGDLPPE